MIKRKILAIFIIFSITWAVKIKDPRTLDFPTTFNFTPHQVTRDTLSNGIEIFLCEDHEVPLVDISFFIDAGENRVPADQTGLAEILVDMIVEGGSKTVPKPLFTDSLEILGASFSGYADTRSSTFRIHLLTENVPGLLPLVAGALRDPALSANHLEILEQQYHTSYQSRNTNPASISDRIFNKLIYGPDSPTARDVTPDALANIDISSLSVFHADNYRPTETVIGVVGDFEPDEIVKILEENLGDWQEPAEESWKELPEITDPSDPGIYLVHLPGKFQSNIIMGYLGLHYDDPHYPEAFILTRIYGISGASRIRTQIRVERGLAYSIYGWISAGLRWPGLFQTSGNIKIDRTLEATNTILDIMDELKTSGVTEVEVVQAKHGWLASFPRYYEDPVQVLRGQVEYARYGYPSDFLLKMPSRIEQLTIDDINKFASEFIEPVKLVILVVGDTTAFDGSASELGEVTVIDPEEY